MKPCLLSQSRIPKYERMQRLAERIGAKDLDRGSVEAFLLLLSVTEELREIANTKLACRGLGEGRMTVLVLLLENQPQSLSHSQLADLLGITKGSITGLVDGLEHDGLVQRCEAQEDRRTRLIAITPAGLAMVNQYLPEKIRGIEQFMTGLTPAERETLSALLLKLQARLPAYRSE